MGDMSMRETDIPVESLNRPSGNSLQDGYQLHDEAEAVFKSLLPEWVTLLSLGIDKREEDDTLIFDDRMDFLLDGPGGEVMIDIKSKSRDMYMRFCNERHYRKYVEAAEEHDCPAYIWFYNTSSDKSQLCRVDGGGEVLATSTHDYILPFPDGNKAAYLTSGTDVEWETMLQQLR